MPQDKSARHAISLTGLIVLIGLLACSTLNPQPLGDGEAETIDLSLTASVAQQLTEVKASSIKLTEDAGAPPHYTSAVFNYSPEQAFFSGVEEVGAVYDFCAPPNLNGSGELIITEFNSLSGICQGDSSDKTLHREGALTGIVDYENNQVSFRLETRRIFSPHPDGKVTMALTFQGNAPLTGSTAAGVGNFDYTCTAEGTLVYCINDSTTLQLNGTMPFQMEFYP